MADLPKDFCTYLVISSECLPLRPIRWLKWRFPTIRQGCWWAVMETRWMKLWPITRHKFAIRRACSSWDMRMALRAYLRSCCQCGGTGPVYWKDERLPACCLHTVEVANNYWRTLDISGIITTYASSYRPTPLPNVIPRKPLPISSRL